MNLRTSQLYLSFFFLLFLISCEKPTDIGLNLPGQNQLGTHFEKQTTLASTVIHPDSILAFRNEPIVLGKVTDGLLGTIVTTHYTEIGLNGTNVSFNVPAGRQADSMVLVMAYYANLNETEKPGYYYGDTTKTMKLNVTRLSENFVAEKTYFTNTVMTLESGVLGTIEFKPKANRTERNGKDFSRLLRIPLDKTFATTLLSKSFATQEEFKAFWKGIAISADPASASGSLVGFSAFPDSAGAPMAKVAGINLYYKDANNKPQVHNFSFGGQYYNGTEITRQGALAGLGKSQEVPATTTSNVTYIQANSGVKTRLTFPNLEKFKEQKGNIFINHAELIIPVKKGTVNAGGFISPAPQSIFLYESTAGNRVRKTAGDLIAAMPIQAGNVSAFNLSSPAVGIYNADSLHYKTNITSYVQAVIDQRKPNNGIIVTPTAEDRASALATGISYPGTLNLNRALLDAAANRIVLRIYYSKLN